MIRGEVEATRHVLAHGAYSAVDASHTQGVRTDVWRVGLIVMLSTSRKQRIGDLAAKTLVVRK